MFEGFEQRTIDCDGVLIHARVGGSGPPLLLLHGYPQTHVMWHLIAPRLAEEFTVVATDLRGYGESSKPETTPDYVTYSKRSMARDQVAVMRALGHEEFYVAGHDRGGRCAYRMALDHPERVRKLAILDIIPTGECFWRADKTFGLGYWHWFFLAQTDDLPERVIGADPDYFWHRLASGLAPKDAFTPEAVEAYLHYYRQPEVIRATCNDYRAGARIDVEYDATDRDQGHKITCPTLVLWGAKGLLERWYDVPAIWRDWADDLRGKALDCGHFVPEERPEETLAELRAFFTPKPSGTTETKGDAA
ncbi:alpha/beta fold hydrolase [Roseovarius azorensis]|nr:alpha/beta hydrolase [Roseovarius azorensis]